MTTIGDPLILSRHEISPKTIPQSRPVLGSCSKGVKDEYASIGIVGEGISIIDLTSLQPDAATLLGPETTFACPPVSRTVIEGSRQQLRQTYAATETPSSGSATKGTTISYWTSSATLSSLEKHRSLTSGQSIQALYAPNWHIDALIVVFTDGDVAKLDSKLEEANLSKKRHNPRRRLIWSFIFDPSKDGEMPEDMEIDKEEVKRKGIVVKHIPNTLNLGHQFITSVLELVFRQESLQPGCYSPKIVAYLLERRLITDSSVKGGLIKALEDRGDWHAITHMLRDTVDISEDALMSLLVNSLRRTRREDAMEVDESSKDPTTPLPCTAILGYVISYPTTAPTMRLAIRKHLTDMNDVLFILNHLKNMMQKSVQGNEGLSLGDLEKEFKGHEVDRRRLTKHGRPKLEMIISFLSTMLDAKLLDIIQYQPTHDLLREIHEFTLPQITWLTTLEKLRGPLEPFVTADKKGSKQPHGDNFAPKQQKWREKKVDSHALTVGLYQLEEFTI
ncbi:hypothetical protein FRC18_007226 [Serendipita sp. 400]|nr:hypothetical protein FRC18_007226 [Serendipita sp. 400]